MGRVFIGLLAVGWGAVLIPAGLRRRSERGSFSLLGLGASFAALFALAKRSAPRANAEVLWSAESGRNYSGGPVAPLYRTANRSTAGARNAPAHQRFAPTRVSRAIRRQRQIVLSLGGLSLALLLLSFVPGLSFLLVGFAFAVVGLGLYMVLLLRVKHQRVGLGHQPTNDRLPWAS